MHNDATALFNQRNGRRHLMLAKLRCTKDWFIAGTANERRFTKLYNEEKAFLAKHNIAFNPQSRRWEFKGAK